MPRRPSLVWARSVWSCRTRTALLVTDEMQQRLRFSLKASTVCSTYFSTSTDCPWSCGEMLTWSLVKMWRENDSTEIENQRAVVLSRVTRLFGQNTLNFGKRWKLKRSFGPLYIYFKNERLSILSCGIWRFTWKPLRDICLAQLAANRVDLISFVSSIGGNFYMLLQTRNSLVTEGLQVSR